MTCKPTSKRNGATIVLILICMVVLFIFVAFAIDIGRIQLAQLKLQTASDLSARASAEAMARGVGDTSNLASFEAAIRDEADMLMQKNSLFGKPITFDSNAQISFGISIPDDTHPGNGKGKGKKKFKFNKGANNGQLEIGSNAIRVLPDLNQFPMMFGTFHKLGSVNLHALASARVDDRDIVLVVDRSTSMLMHDAGLVDQADYPTNLFNLEESLYTVGDLYHPSTANGYATASSHTEFEVDSVTGKLRLSKLQAIKLAILKFREVIDETTGNEQLGFISYSQSADLPTEAQAPVGAVDITAGLGSAVFSQMVGDGITDRDATEKYACDLEDRANNYDNFDYNYLAMRWYGNTNIVDGIERGTEILFSTKRRLTARPVLIVMTDGMHNTTLAGNASSPLVAAQNAASAHPEIQIYTITFGSGANQTAMQEVANAGNGKHYHASDVNQLIDVFKELAVSAGVTVFE